MSTGNSFTQEECQQAVNYIKENGPCTNTSVAKTIKRSPSGTKNMLNNEPNVLWLPYDDSKDYRWVYRDPVDVTKITVLNAGPSGTMTFDYSKVFHRLRAEKNK